jgi:hypothetical protein
MKKSNCLITLSFVPFVASAFFVCLLPSPSEANFLKGVGNSIKKEVNNCISGGCNPLTSPKEIIRTTTGARAVGAATNRWYNRQVRINTAKANDAKNRLKKYLNGYLKCWEFPSMEGVCTEINNYHGLSLPIQRVSWQKFDSLYNPTVAKFARNCISQKNLVFGNAPSNFQCFPYSQFFE